MIDGLFISQWKWCPTIVKFVIIFYLYIRFFQLGLKKKKTEKQVVLLRSKGTKEFLVIHYLHLNAQEAPFVGRPNPNKIDHIT